MKIEEGIKILLDEMEISEWQLTERQCSSVEEFVLVSTEYDDEILDGIDHQIPMTYALYQRTIDVLQQLEVKRTLKEFVDDFGRKFST